MTAAHSDTLLEAQKPIATPIKSRLPKARTLAFVAAAVAAIGVIGGEYIAHRGLESTDNAQVDGEVISVPARVGGTVAKVLFIENQTVKEGDVLAELDDEQAKAKLAQAEANLTAAEASAEAADADVQVAETNAVGNKSVAEASLQTASAGAATTQDQIKEAEAQVRSADASLKQAEAERSRAKVLFDSGAMTQAQFDQSETAVAVATSTLDLAKARLATTRMSAVQAKSRIVEASVKVKQTSDVDTVIKLSRARAKSAHAQVETAKAARDLAALDLSYTKIRAPHDGVASKKTIAVGQTVAAGQGVVQLVTPTLWVTGNFKETQLDHMRVGQAAHAVVDAYPEAALEGEIESFSGATGARFTLLPPDNATGNFTKVVQRVPVRVKLHDVPSGVVLRPGMSVELSVDTRK